MSNRKKRLKSRKANEVPTLSTKAQVESERLWFIDIARLYGIFLVYYGHFIGRIMPLNSPTAAIHYKFIYSFHMILFFMLAGYITKESDIDLKFYTFLKQRFFTRIVPLIFFNFLLIVSSLNFSGDAFALGIELPSISGYITGLLVTALGTPAFNVPTWFLLCLFTLEMVHYISFRYLKSDSIILLAALVFYIVGYIINWKIVFQVNIIPGFPVGWNFYYLNEALIIYSFYLLGIYFRHKKMLIGNISPLLIICSLVLCLLVVLFTFNINIGPFRRGYPFNVVLIEYSQHGNFNLFPITAIAGCIFIMLLAKLTPFNKNVVMMGQNALILFGLNGIFFHFINGRLAVWFMNNFSDNFLNIFCVGMLVTFVSLISCVPFILLFNKYVPQFVGRPKIKGPILNNFI
jgi:acyltransferase